MAQGSLTRAAAAAAILFGVVGCAQTPLPPGPPPLLSPPPLARRVQSRAPVPPAAAGVAADACGASRLQYLVGRPETDIPVPVDPDRRRVLCSTCVMTSEHEPWRQTIIFSSMTGRVTSVTCG
jgi:hypothetical protein